MPIQKRSDKWVEDNPLLHELLSEPHLSHRDYIGLQDAHHGVTAHSYLCLQKQLPLGLSRFHTFKWSQSVRKA